MPPGEEPERLVACLQGGRQSDLLILVWTGIERVQGSKACGTGCPKVTVIRISSVWSTGHFYTRPSASMFECLFLWEPVPCAQRRDSVLGALQLVSQYTETGTLINKLSKVTVDWEQNYRESRLSWDWAWGESGCWDLALQDALASLSRDLSLMMDMWPEEEEKSEAARAEQAQKEKTHQSVQRRDT